MVRAERAALAAALNADGEAGAAALRRRRPESAVRARNRTRLVLGARGCYGESDYGVRAGHKRPQRAYDGEQRRTDSGEAARMREREV